MHLSTALRAGCTLAGALEDFVRRPAKNLQRLRRLTRFQDHDPEDMIWALKDVSFEVKRGEVVGIPSATLRASIGRNGAVQDTPVKYPRCLNMVDSALK